MALPTDCLYRVFFISAGGLYRKRKKKGKKGEKRKKEMKGKERKGKERRKRGVQFNVLIVVLVNIYYIYIYKETKRKEKEIKENIFVYGTSLYLSTDGKGIGAVDFSNWFSRLRKVFSCHSRQVLALLLRNNRLQSSAQKRQRD
jgi:hypothetical protein